MTSGERYHQHTLAAMISDDILCCCCYVYTTGHFNFDWLAAALGGGIKGSSPFLPSSHLLRSRHRVDGTVGFLTGKASTSRVSNVFDNTIDYAVWTVSYMRLEKHILFGHVTTWPNNLNPNCGLTPPLAHLPWSVVLAGAPLELPPPIHLE
eukprot:4372646-Pyramimonas_sp.AAC.1